MLSPSDWRDPDPLLRTAEPLAYPEGLLPTILCDAVREVQAFVQAPMALVAASALSALSAAAQGLVNVRRDAQLLGPVSLYLLAVADSGERKSTCDAIFGRALRRWEADRRIERAQELRRHEADTAVFEARRAALLDAIRFRRRRNQGTDADEQALAELVRNAPNAPVVPRLLYADATPEALAHGLASQWPSGILLSAEAGAVFGAHAMGTESVVRNLALLNVLWDGGEIAIDRRSKPSFLLRDRRLSLGLMVQPQTLRAFIAKAGALPRGSGFLARLLIAWPGSTQGQRAYRAAPASMDHVGRFEARIRALLDHPLSTDAHGGLDPAVLDLSDEARAEWVRFHDATEAAMGPDGRWREIRDVAAKAAENAARLAALFHVLEHGPSGSIGHRDIQAAVCIVQWHLSEAARLLPDIGTSGAMSAAIRLDDWLLTRARQTSSDRVATRQVFQYGPPCVRNDEDFREALTILSARGRARLEQVGRRRYVAVNPWLLSDPS
jgi:putative DNA primase/helicase